MEFYIILFITLVGLAYLSSFLHQHDYENRIMLGIIDVLPFVILIIITGFRYQVGTDYDGYLKNFELLKYYEIDRIEISFRMIVSAAYFLHLNHQFVFLVYAIITYLFLYFAIRFFDPEAKYRHFIVGLLMTFFLFNIFNTIRQMAAVSILAFGLQYLVKKQWFHYLLMAALAFFFHRSSIAFSFIFFIALLFPIKYYIFLLIIAPFLFFTNFINLMIGLFVRITGMDFYLIYVTGNNGRVSLSSGLGIIIFYLIAVILFLFFDHVAENEKERTIVKLYILYAALYLVFLPSEVATRMLYYPMLAVPLAIPLLGNLSPDRRERVYLQYAIVGIMLFLFIDLMVVSQSLMTNGSILDYNFMLIGFE